MQAPPRPPQNLAQCRFAYAAGDPVADLAWLPNHQGVAVVALKEHPGICLLAKEHDQQRYVELQYAELPQCERAVSDPLRVFVDPSGFSNLGVCTDGRLFSFGVGGAPELSIEKMDCSVQLSRDPKEEERLFIAAERNFGMDRLAMLTTNDVKLYDINRADRVSNWTAEKLFSSHSMDGYGPLTSMFMMDSQSVKENFSFNVQHDQSLLVGAGCLVKMDLRSKQKQLLMCPEMQGAFITAITPGEMEHTVITGLSSGDLVEWDVRYGKNARLICPRSTASSASVAALKFIEHDGVLCTFTDGGISFVKLPKEGRPDAAIISEDNMGDAISCFDYRHRQGIFGTGTGMVFMVQMYQ